jgi:PAS domain S-box-containing protein
MAAMQTYAVLGHDVVQFAVARVLAEADSLAEATPTILQAIGECLDCQMGALWWVDRTAKVLHCMDTWQDQEQLESAFHRLTRQSTLPPAAGLPGRVWAAGQPIWITDIAAEPLGNRAALALDEGFRSASGFPIRKGAVTLGVLEFYSRQTRQPDTNLAAVVAVLGGPIGQFIERKRTEEENIRLARSFRMLLKSTGEGIYGIDLEGKCLFINKAACRMIGYTPREALGKNMHELIHHSREDGSACPAPKSRLFQPLVTGRTARVEDEVIWRKDGTSFPAEYSVYPMVEEGVIRGAMVRFTDITERHRLRAMMIQTEKLVSIGLLSAGMAHEINNPLAYVANNLFVLERDTKSLLRILAQYDSIREQLGRINPEAVKAIQESAERLGLAYIRDNMDRILAKTREGVQRVAKIVHNLRGLARTDDLELVETSIADLVESSLELIRGRLQERGIKVTVDYGNANKLCCVPTQIGQVLLNLLMNALQAIEATGRPGGMITLTAREVDQEMIIEVSDNGCGIDPGDMPRLFDPFFTTKPVGEGTGLGLSITHGIVTSHGGRIDVDSTPGDGARFRVVLPLNPPPRFS